jgi:hypothetical protein
MANADCQRFRESNESSDQCFAGWFDAPGEIGIVRRKAREICKAEPAQSAPVGGSAYAKLMVEARGLRKSQPHLSEAQCFDRIFSDPAYRSLAKRERAENGF